MPLEARKEGSISIQQKLCCSSTKFFSEI